MSPLVEASEARRRRMAALLQDHEREVAAHLRAAAHATELTVADQGISRCGRCQEWRYRASYLDCQACGDLATAFRSFDYGHVPGANHPTGVWLRVEVAA